MAAAAIFLTSGVLPAAAAQSKLDRFVSDLFEQVAPKAKKVKRARSAKAATQARADSRALPENPPLPTAAPDRADAADPTTLAPAAEEPLPTLAYAPVPPPALPPAVVDTPANKDVGPNLAVLPAPKEPSADDAGGSEAVPERTTEKDVLLASIPVPQPRPDLGGGKQDGGSTGEDGAPSYSDPAGATRATSPADELACRARLKKRGVQFEELGFISDANGCAVVNPISVTSLGAGIALNPSATMNCAMAEAAAGFAQDTVAPRAQSAFGSELTGIEHASAYICRPRHGTQKLSEHAFGNALDISAFRLRDKRRIEVHDTKVDGEATFLASVRGAACGPFKTVLGPGVADHDTHFHFDLEPRRRGGTYCR